MYAVDVSCGVRFAVTIGLLATYPRRASTLGLPWSQNAAIRCRRWSLSLVRTIVPGWPGRINAGRYSRQARTSAIRPGRPTRSKR